MATLAWTRSGSRGELKLTFRGWPAIVLMGLLAAAPLANILITRSALPDGGLEAVREGLSLEYRLKRLSGIDSHRLTREEGERLQQDLTRLKLVELQSVRSKGWLWNRVVRVEVSVDGGLPPDGREIRYLFLSCVPEVGCMILDEVSWIRYGLGLWFVEPPVAAFPSAP
jgi:hypothetical protein